ncbi:MAG: N-acetyltransferase [Planctomycetaceae bacterium]|nr:N-acetyltransferase [Planctomycetaceae bacterium]
MFIAETERLIIRQFDIADGDAMDCVFGDAEVMYYGRGVQTPHWVRNWLRGCLDDYQRRRDFEVWGVVDKSGRK